VTMANFLRRRVKGASSGTKTLSCCAPDEHGTVEAWNFARRMGNDITP
jgi:hypothetical protein